MIRRLLLGAALAFALSGPARAGAPNGLTIGADRTQSPAVVCIVNASTCLATLGTYTSAGVWIPANALVPANNLSDVASPATARGNLGLGTIATQAASGVAITGGTIDTTSIGGTKPGPAWVTTLAVNATGVAFPPPTLPLYIGGSGNVGVIDNYSGSASAGIGSATLVFRNARGTAGAPSAVQAGDLIGAFGARGYGATSFASFNTIKLNFLATQNWTDSAWGSAFAIQTTANGTTASAEAMRVDQSGYVGIGTTTPAYPLDVSGSARVTGSLTLGSTLAAAYGGTGAASLSGGLDAAFGSTQGMLLVRGGSGWTALAPGSAGQILASGGPNANPAWQTATGTGTVTSVGLALPSIFGVTGSPVTGSGTLTASLAGQAPNTVLAGPGSGASNAAPGFRVLVNADFPASAASTIRGNAGGSAATPTDLTPAQAKALLGYAASGPNSDITALTGLSTPLPASEGGTGAATASANTVLAGPASGGSAAPSLRALVPSDDPAAADGCVRLTIASTTALALNPYGCTTLTIGGVPRIVTTTTCSISSPTAATLYYVYASWSGSTVTCSFSTTGHIAGSDGRQYLNSSGSANTAYVLVGMAYTNTSASPFIDTQSQRWVASYFNRRGRGVKGASSTNTATASTSFVQDNSLNTSALFWGDDDLDYKVSGTGYVSGAGQYGFVSAWIDGAQTGPSVANYFATGSASECMAYDDQFSLAEGLHNVSVAIESGNSSSSFNTTGLILTYQTRI